MGQHGKYLFWPQLLNRSSNFHAVLTNALRNKSPIDALTKEISVKDSLCPGKCQPDTFEPLQNLNWVRKALERLIFTQFQSTIHHILPFFHMLNFHCGKLDSKANI